jgi:hypothetical protein
MFYAPRSILFRINWCRRQRAQACTDPEMQRWRAEEEGLRDALLKRDHTSQYRYFPVGVSERYAMGFEDGRSMIRLACVDRHFATAASRTQVLPIPMRERQGETHGNHTRHR